MSEVLGCLVQGISGLLGFQVCVDSRLVGLGVRVVGDFACFRVSFLFMALEVE